MATSNSLTDIDGCDVRSVPVAGAVPTTWYSLADVEEPSVRVVTLCNPELRVHRE